MKSIGILLLYSTLAIFADGLKFPAKPFSVHRKFQQLQYHQTPTAHFVSADYASEIQNAVGPEIYGPIFKAGIFIFLSGFVSAFTVAYIVTKNNLWDSLLEEFDEGTKIEGAKTTIESNNVQSDLEELRDLDI